MIQKPSGFEPLQTILEGPLYSTLFNYNPQKKLNNFFKIILSKNFFIKKSLDSPLIKEGKPLPFLDKLVQILYKIALI